MKKIIILMVCLLCYASGHSENIEENKSNQMYTWMSKTVLGKKVYCDLDTSLNGFNITNPAYKKSIAVQHLGNIGSPALSLIFLDRVNKSNFLFFNPYQLYYYSPEDIIYYNTKRPYSNITYLNGGPSNRKQEILNGIFSININPHFNMGMYGRWQNNYGAYNSQSSKNYNAGFFGSYIHRHHELMSNISFNGYETYENGGLTDTRYVTDPKNTGNLDEFNMPTYFDDNVISKIKNWNGYLNYKYHFGFDKDVKINEDSISTVFIPVSSIIYTLKTENSFRKYKENATYLADTFYVHKGIGNKHEFNNIAYDDSVHFFDMSHTIGLSLNEEYNTLAKFGLSAYLNFEQKKYGMFDRTDLYDADYVEKHNLILDATNADSVGMLGRKHWNNASQNKVGIGASIFKHHGEHLFFDFDGIYYFKDEKKTNNSYSLNGNIETQFSIKNNTFFLRGNASQQKTCPDYFEENYYSNRLQWTNNFDNIIKSTIEGEIGAKKIRFYSDSSSNKIKPELGLSFLVNETNIKNYVYWAKNAKPAQAANNINIFTFAIKEDFKFWYLHFDNQLTIQNTNSDVSVLDLPTLSWYSNAYILTNPIFKSLTIQIGGDMRYNTSYYASAYLPSNGMFYNQNEIKTGNYAYYDLYLNFCLRNIRVFLEYNHINNIWSNNRKYIITPGYPADPKYIKFGISVNFAN